MTIASPTESQPANSVVPARHSTLRWLLKRVLLTGLVLGTAVLLIVVVGWAQRRGWFPTVRTPGATPVAAGETFTCPMHPQIRQPAPGRCPICGMELVRASSAAADLDELSVKIEPAQRRLANIQMAPVEVGPLEDELQTVGVIAVDESRQATIAAYIDGRLERLFADYTGIDIKNGDHLAIIYSPQLFAAQVEYLESRRAARASEGLPAIRQAQDALAANTRQRLREYGMTDEQLAELERTGQAESRLTIYAPQGGTVVEKLAVEGNYVKAGDPIYRVADLSTVWLMLKLFPEDATRIRFGQRVQATVQSLPGEPLVGRVAFIDPTVDPKTRTVGVRVELLNENRRLRPGDYAAAQINLPIGSLGEIFDADLSGKWISPMHPQIIRGEPGQCPICGMDLVPTSEYGFSENPVPPPQSIHVPRSAVLLAGENSVVYVETEPGVFQLRPVTVGPILRDKIVILEGLKSGEMVATSGNFLIDSQMQLAGKPSLIDPTWAVAQTAGRKGPKTLETIDVTQIGGEAGKLLERLYASYFQVQQALAADKRPGAAESQALHEAAVMLRDDPGLLDSARKLTGEIARHSEHLHHFDLEGARKAFKPLSHAVLSLAAQLRSEGARQEFTHFYCPMVPDGGGDWLQPGGNLLNPYFGSQMLHCGATVQVLPTEGESAGQTRRPATGGAAPAREGK